MEVEVRVYGLMTEKKIGKSNTVLEEVEVEQEGGGVGVYDMAVLDRKGGRGVGGGYRGNDGPQQGLEVPLIVTGCLGRS